MTSNGAILRRRLLARVCLVREEVQNVAREAVFSSGKGAEFQPTADQTARLRGGVPRRAVAFLQARRQLEHTIRSHHEWFTRLFHGDSLSIRPASCTCVRAYRLSIPERAWPPHMCRQRPTRGRRNQQPSEQITSLTSEAPVVETYQSLGFCASRQ